MARKQKTTAEVQAEIHKREHRKRFSIPLALLAAVVVFSFFGMAATSRRPEAAALPLPEFTISTDAALITSPPSAAETPAPYVPDEAEVEMLARVLWGEARGVPSDMEKAAVVWCVLNRVDAERWPDTVAGVVTEPSQFAGYSPDYPATEELKTIAADVLTRWERERQEEANAAAHEAAGDPAQCTFNVDTSTGELLEDESEAGEDG